MQRNMNLDDAQRKKITEWIAQGLKLSEIQSRLSSELGLTLTYMDVRLLVDDLKLVPKDSERPKPTSSPLAAPSAPSQRAPAAASEPAAPNTGQKPAAPASVSVSVDQLTRPGAVASGKVVFTDGNQADWYIDQTGRLGLAPQQAGYRPPASDVQQFQMALENELAKLGF
jgi:hypothetical protein